MSIEIKAYQNGPLVIQGEIRLSDPASSLEKAPQTSIALCRCGNSAKGLICDGTHKHIGYCAKEFDILVGPLAAAVAEVGA